MLRNLMSYKVKGINGEDLRVKVHPLRKYFIRDSDREIICRLKNFFTYALYSFCSYLCYNQLQNLSPGLFDHCAWLKEVYVEH